MRSPRSLPTAPICSSPSVSRISRGSRTASSSTRTPTTSARCSRRSSSRSPTIAPTSCSPRSGRLRAARPGRRPEAGRRDVDARRSVSTSAPAATPTPAGPSSPPRSSCLGDRQALFGLLRLSLRAGDADGVARAHAGLLEQAGRSGVRGRDRARPPRQAPAVLPSGGELAVDPVRSARRRARRGGRGASHVRRSRRHRQGARRLGGRRAVGRAARRGAAAPRPAAARSRPTPATSCARSRRGRRARRRRRVRSGGPARGRQRHRRSDRHASCSAGAAADPERAAHERSRAAILLAHAGRLDEALTELEAARKAATEQGGLAVTMTSGLAEALVGQLPDDARGQAHAALLGQGAGQEDWRERAHPRRSEPLRAAHALVERDGATIENPRGRRRRLALGSSPGSRRPRRHTAPASVRSPSGGRIAARCSRPSRMRRRRRPTRRGPPRSPCAAPRCSSKKVTPPVPARSSTR